MKPTLLRKLVPHIIAVLVFIIIAALYCYPSLEGKALQQHDTIGWKGSVQQSVEYSQQHGGKYPLWTNAVFGGMPTFQIAAPSNNFIPAIVHKIMTVGLPEPMQYFFLASISFYLLCIVLGINPFVGIIGALGFAYATYNPVIINAGHITKMWSIGYMPALLASILLIFEKKYWLGAALTALFSATLISMNHLQIAYYFFFTLAIMSIFFLVKWIKAKEYKHLALAAVFTIAGAAIGILTNAVSLLSTYEYQKETIRGGASALTDTTAAQQQKNTNGLDRDYAFSYSVGITEPLVMLIPRMYGGSSDKEEVKQEKSKAIEAMRTMPGELQQQMPLAYYWGGIKDVGGFTYTSGPPYIGAIIIFLALLSFFVLDSKHKWWALAATLFSIMLSWGYYFKDVNYFLFDHFPMYNKFRAHSIALVIPQLLLPMLAVLGVNKLLTTDTKESWPKFKKGLIATGILFVVVFLIYLTADFLSDSNKELLQQARNSGQPQIATAVESFFGGLKADRQGLFMADIWRSLGFILLAAATLFFAIRKKIGAIFCSLLLTAFVLVDLLTIDSNYLKKDDYKDSIENDFVFVKSDADKAILQDTGFYRVLNLGGDVFGENGTSYHFNSIGGYHAAKLRLYQDLIGQQISHDQQAIIGALQIRPDSVAQVHSPALNMLNTKYFLYKEKGQTKAFWSNPNAMGNCWFVNNIQFVKNADEEMAALATANLRTTALVQESLKNSIAMLPQADSSAVISLVKNDNDYILYHSQSATNQFAVFSEVYYAAGWKALIDGKETPIVKTNYLLRGLAVPAGRHTIEFKFEPSGYYKGKKLTSVFLILLFVFLVGAASTQWLKTRRKQ